MMEGFSVSAAEGFTDCGWFEAFLSAAVVASWSWKKNRISNRVRAKLAVPLFSDGRHDALVAGSRYDADSIFTGVSPGPATGWSGSWSTVTWTSVSATKQKPLPATVLTNLGSSVESPRAF